MKAVNPNDLRLGNWLKHSPDADWAEEAHNKPIQVDMYTLIEIVDTYGHSDIKEPYLPVEISPEILEKAGFVKEGDASYMSDAFWIEKSPHQWIFRFIVSSMEITRIQYVHELQNLFYCINGSELPLNL